jgi:RHS repeat-associated protein
MKTRFLFHGCRLATLLSLFLTSEPIEAATPNIAADKAYGLLPLHFEPNVGQVDSQIHFVTRGGNYSFAFLTDEIILVQSIGTNGLPAVSSNGVVQAEEDARVLGLKFQGANAGVQVVSSDQLPGKANYLTGDDPAQWRTNISLFGKVIYQQVYPGIDATFHGTDNHLEYDFAVQPQADPSVIQISIEGESSVIIDENGNLSLGTGENTVLFKKPFAYQTVNGVRQEIEATFSLTNNTLSFQLGAYDHNSALIIDPVLSYSTFLGGLSIARAVAVDEAGHAYIAGDASGNLSLITPGAYQTNRHARDAFVAKLNSTGTGVDYVTYLGGNNDEYAYGIAFDRGGNACVVGWTFSGNFPLLNALEGNVSTSIGTVGLGFVTKLNSNGTALIHSTYLGGNNASFVQAVAIDSDDNSYVTGYATGSSGFPVTANAYSADKPSAGPAFISKINSNGTAFVYSTKVHGRYSRAIVLDSDRNAYVVGETGSTTFPCTNAFQTTFGGGTTDGMLFKLSANGQTNLMSSFIGGADEEFGVGIGRDHDGNIFICGRTASTDFPVTNALQTRLNNGANNSSTDGYIAKVSASGQLLFSTYLGGANNDDTRAAYVQENGDVVIVGQTGSIDFAPYNNYGSINDGNFDGFIAKLNSQGNLLKNFAYIGGNKEDDAIGVFVDRDENAYVVGYTYSADFPITSTNVVDPTFNGSAGSSENAYITKLFFEPNQLGTKVALSWNPSDNWSLKPATTFAASNTWAGVSQLANVSSNGVVSLTNNRFQRGVSYDPTFTSFLIPLNGQTGVRLDDLGDNSVRFGDRPWFTRLQSDVRSHLSLIASTNISGVSTSYYNYVTNFNNPIAAFGSTAGGSPLYLNTQVKFGVYCGQQYESTNSDGTVFQSPLRVLVYRLSDFTVGQTNLIAPIATNYIALPRRTLTNDQATWNQFATNGFTVRIETNGLRTTVELADSGPGVWGVVPQFANARSGTYIVTQEATTNAGYGYVLEGVGAVPLNTNLYPMVTNSAGAVGWDRLYAMDFTVRPPWRSVFIDQPQFDGTPLPSFYQGASLGELTNLNAVLTNSIALTDSVYTNLDSSPELRRHPALDKLVRDMNNDPITLANYVANRIELTDALAYNENTGQASAPVLNQGGINRNALGVYLEGQGSPAEQCALLVYLLRQAGYPAAYVFPTNNNVLIQDTRLSKLLRMQLHGAVNDNGQIYTTNTAITVNYPWVVTTISNSCIHLFPWLKDTEVVEGQNLYDFMPTNYDNGFKWMRNYIFADTNILSLNLISDAPSVLFPTFVRQQLQTNNPALSLDDIGIQCFNRQHYYSRWSDFPTPTIVTNASQVVCVDSLTSPSIVNVSSAMTNIFNTVSVTVFSLNNTNTQMTVGPLRMADLHNREMLALTNGSGLKLWLEPFIAGNTNQSAFDGSDSALTNIQAQVLSIAPGDTQFAIRMTHNRHRSIGAAPTSQFLGITETLQFTTPDRPFNRQDVTALCFNVGRVTPAMLDIHASAYQQMIYQWQLNSNAAPTTEYYQGAAAYLMGMDYYAKVSQFIPVDEQMHKARAVSWFAEGLSKLTPMQLGAQRYMRPSMDMFFSEIAYAGNGTSHPDSGNSYLAGTQDFARILTGEIAAQEHSLLNGFYLSSNSVSSVVLLRLAQQRAGTGVSGIIELTKNNYLTVGNTNAAGYGPTKLQNYDADIWNAVTSAFVGGDADYVRAYITPGPVAVPTASYRGMGLVIVGKNQSASIISLNMNGVMGEPSAYHADEQAMLMTSYSSSSSTAAARTADFSTGTGGSGSSGGSSITGGPGSGGDVFYSWSSPYSPSWLYSPMVPYYAKPRASATPPSQVDFARQINAVNFYASTTPTLTSLNRALDSGHTGSPTWKNSKNYVLDPVNAMSGEFYHDVVDLTLAGPNPLQLRRNYSSQNLGDRNGFGYGWNINIVPYLNVATNLTTNVVLTAVELDGSVIAYRQQTNDLDLFVPVQQDNPQLDNFGGGRIGSIYNPFNARVRRSTVGTNEVYTLAQADGQIRTYIVNSFPVYYTTNSMMRQRPYLTTWKDTEGNTWSCTYGTNSMANDYGSLTRIQCSNGNFLGLRYNAGGYVIEAYTGDGQFTSYEYDDFGDLVRAIRPDASEERYEYQHTLYTNSSTLYIDSSHLMVQQVNPGGRILQNIYDSLRRVVVQRATVGSDLNVYTNGIFTYSNNFAMPLTNAITGFTLVKDVNGSTNRYYYTNSLMMVTVDALNQTNQMNWYATNAVAPGYPRSPWQTKDVRGRWTEYQYDLAGNVTNTFTWGDLTGDGTTQYATNRTVYDTNNLPTQITDAVGNGVQFVYSSAFPHLPQYIVRLAGTTPVSSNQFDYYNVTNIVANGNLSFTNTAFGLLRQVIRSCNTPDAATNQWSFDGRGYLTQEIRFTGTADPAVTNTFFCNARGEVVMRMDAAGRRSEFDYDGVGRPTSTRIFENNQSVPLFWQTTYYNANGQVTWTDGPQFNPEDYIWRDYDGAGRLTSELHWRAEAMTNGLGVQAPSGDSLYAQWFHEYDKFGNLTRTIDPRGAIATNLWDALGRLTQRKSYDLNGTTILSTEGFVYEPGGLVRYYTNALGAFTETQYTTDGQPKYQRGADGSTNAWRYYLDGRVRREIQGNGVYWETAYNDAARQITRIFYSATGTPLATNVAVYDRRGNLSQSIDAGGNSYTNAYDGLDRLKIAAGPAVTSVVEQCNSIPNCGVYVTNVYQTAVTNFYDDAGVALTTANTLGEKTVRYFDALGRTTRTEIRDSANTVVRESSASYSPDFHSVTITNGSGTNAVVSTSYADNDGHIVLSVIQPSPGLREFSRNTFDLVGNLVYQSHASTMNGVTTEWSYASSTFDGLNRILSRSDRDNAATTFAYDALGDLTNRTMPGGLKWNATYSTSGQLLKEWNASGSLGLRTNVYTYFASGSPFAGLLQTSTDPRSVVCTHYYDDWLRPASNVYSGTLNEHNLTTTWSYDARGLLTDAAESFSSTNVMPATSVVRGYDQNSRPTSEYVNLGAANLSTFYQGWNTAGRRTQITSTMVASYGFSWRADGALTAVSGPPGLASYTYNTAGQLQSRNIGEVTTTTDSRDGAGRPLHVTTQYSLSTLQQETLGYSEDGLLAAHTIEGAITDTEEFTYAPLSRRLVQEKLVAEEPYVGVPKYWTNSFIYDNGQAGGLGVLTKAGAPSAGSAVWTASADSFSRISAETNNVLRRPAFGRVNGAATVEGWLDQDKPVAMSLLGTSGGQWNATLNLTPGAHQLFVRAHHPSGQYEPTATSWFTNASAGDRKSNAYDAAGFLTQRVWISSNGQTNRTQALSWDAKGRLWKVVERDSSTNGFDWTASYDAFGRRLQTIAVPVTNGVSLTSQAKTITSYYDPEVEFLELGFSYDTKTTWKVYGPDLNGVYGGMNGVGGLESFQTGISGSVDLVKDARGNVTFYDDTQNNQLWWNTSRATGYGAIPGYEPPPLGYSTALGQAATWRGKWKDITGLYYLGARYYNPESGSFVSSDPMWNGGDPSYYSFAGGDPINGFDPDGRTGKTIGGSDLASLNQSRIVAGLLPFGANGRISTIICHGMSASGPVPGVPLTYTYMNGRVYNSRGNGRIIGNFNAGVAGGAASSAQNIGNFAINTVSLPLRMLQEGEYVPLGNHFSRDPLYAHATASWVEKQIYSGVDQNSLITFSGEVGGNLIGPSLYGSVFRFGMGAFSRVRLGSEMTWQDFLAEAQTRVNGSRAQAGGYTFYNVSPDSGARRMVQGSYVNPLNNEVVITAESLAADHIYPQVQIKQLLGFNLLTAEQQAAVLNNPVNFQGLPKTFNSSKGGMLPAEWSTYKGMQLDAGYIQRNQMLQQQIETTLQAQINAFISRNANK